MGIPQEYSGWRDTKHLLEELEKQPEFFNLFLTEFLEFKGVHLPELFMDISSRHLPPPSWRMLLSLTDSYHVTQILLASTSSPGVPRQASLDTFLDDFRTCIKKPE
jgi:hypothetical protein